MKKYGWYKIHGPLRGEHDRWEGLLEDVRCQARKDVVNVRAGELRACDQYAAISVKELRNFLYAHPGTAPMRAVKLWVFSLASLSWEGAIFEGKVLTKDREMHDAFERLVDTYVSSEPSKMGRVLVIDKGVEATLSQWLSTHFQISCRYVHEGRPLAAEEWRTVYAHTHQCSSCSKEETCQKRECHVHGRFNEQGEKRPCAPCFRQGMLDLEEQAFTYANRESPLPGEATACLNALAYQALAYSSEGAARVREIAKICATHKPEPSYRVW